MMEMIMMVMAEDVDPGLVLRKLTSVASGLAPEPEMRRRERERDGVCVSAKRARPGVDISRTGSHIVSHCLVMEIISPRLPPPSHSHSPVSLHTAINNRIFECRRYLHISPSTSSQYLDGEMFLSRFAKLVSASGAVRVNVCVSSVIVFVIQNK